jgi:hypothetical protein
MLGLMIIASPGRRPGLALAGSALLAWTSVTGAIEAPATASVAGAPDRTGFYRKLVAVDRAQALRDLDVPADIADRLSRAEVPATVSELEGRAAKGDVAANVALVRTQHWCAGLARPPNPPLEQTAQQLREALPPEELPDALGVLAAEQAFNQSAAAACSQARFAFQEIERRLRAAAAAGDAVSASELARFTRDASKREAFLEAAAEAGYAPAQYQLAVNRLFAVQRGETTEKVDTIRLLLKQAGQTLPAAKVDLANCMATGCDGHPADTATAAAFAVDAARDGAANAFAGMLRMPWRSSLDAAEIAAWQRFAERLNEAGCNGTAYLATKTGLSRINAQFAAALSAEQRERADSLATRYWDEFSARAKREQRCD